MADLRGQELRDSYQNVVTRGTGNKLDDGNGVEFADLDDKASLSMFESGEWTPFFEAESGSLGSIVYVGSSTGGIYSKIDNKVTACARIRTDDFKKGTGSGSLRIAGLPFISKNTGLTVPFGGILSTISGVLTQGVKMVDGTTEAIMIKTDGNNLNLSEVTEGVRQDFTLTITYLV